MSLSTARPPRLAISNAGRRSDARPPARGRRRCARSRSGDPWRYFLALFLGAVVAELLEISPQVADVLVILDADERHAGAGHFLHRRVDILGERCLVPGDAGFLVGLGVVE